MSESVASGRALEVSISFGKFENDSLSWEKWSSFSPNKHLEEVEKCSTPGSVAQKKAYFEAHYKKIAARKVDQLEPEKQVVAPAHHLRSEESKQEETLVESSSVVENGFEPSNGNRSEPEVLHKPIEICPVNSETDNESKDVAAIDIECKSSSVEEVKEEVICKQDSSKISNRGKIVQVEEETTQTNAECVVEEKPKSDNESGKTPQMNNGDVVEQKPKSDNDSGKSYVKKDKNLKGNVKGTYRKIHPSTNDRPASVGTRKTSATPAEKSSKVSSFRSSLTPTSKVVSPSPSLTKRANGSSLQKIKNTPLTDTKKLASRSLMTPPQSSTKIQTGSTLHRSKNSPMIDSKKATRSSLHMSLNMSQNSSPSKNVTRTSVNMETGSANAIASHGTMGRSLIMDKMGHKEIVRRAFKTFRNSFNEVKPSGDNNKRYSGSEQMASKGPEQKSSGSLTPRGENGRFGKPDQRLTIQKGQSGTKSISVSSRTPLDTGVERRKMTTTRPSIGLMNDGTNGTLKKEGAKTKTHRPIK